MFSLSYIYDCMFFENFCFVINLIGFVQYGFHCPLNISQALCLFIWFVSLVRLVSNLEIPRGLCFLSR